VLEEKREVSFGLLHRKVIDVMVRESLAPVVSTFGYAIQEKNQLDKFIGSEGQFFRLNEDISLEFCG
jgi:hypothetical protein